MEIVSQCKASWVVMVNPLTRIYNVNPLKNNFQILKHLKLSNNKTMCKSRITVTCYKSYPSVMYFTALRSHLHLLVYDMVRLVVSAKKSQHASTCMKKIQCSRLWIHSFILTDWAFICSSVSIAMVNTQHIQNWNPRNGHAHQSQWGQWMRELL